MIRGRNFVSDLRRVTLYIMNITDVLSLIAAFIISYIIKFKLLPNEAADQPVTAIYIVLLLSVIVSYLIVNILFLYNDNYMERNSRKEMLASLKMVVYVTVFVIIFLFMFKISSRYSRALIIGFFLLAFLIDYAARVIVKKYIFPKYKSGNMSEKMVVIAPLKDIEETVKKLDNPMNWRSKITALVVTDKDMKGTSLYGVPVISNIKEMYYDIAQAEADSVFVVLDKDGDGAFDCVPGLQELGKTVHVKINEFYLNDTNKVVDKMGDYAVVSYLPNVQIRNRRIFIKRTIDILIAIILLPLYIIVSIIVGIFIVLESPGKILNARVRVGKNGRRFYQYRFRCLRMDADTRIAEGKSPYMIIGKFLSKLHLDGFPMIINVLYGDLSFVGPNSPTLNDFMRYSAQQRRNMCVTTGIVGCWSCESDKETIIAEEQDYIEHWNLLQDFKIVLEMIVRYITFHSKRKCTEGTVREEMEQIAEYRQFKRPLHYDSDKYVRKYTAGDYVYLFVKRAVDIVVSAAALIVLSPVLLIIAILVIADDGGNPFYGHIRIGKNGRRITVYKFRSMRKDAGDLNKLLTPAQLEQYQKEFKIDNDPRITRVGSFLRKTSLDELPQLLNILKGDISIVGPRPIVEKETKIYGDDIAKFLSVKPGLTGYWQAYARNNATYSSGERQRMEMYYVDNQSVWLDIKIVFKTVESVIKREGAQ